MAARHGVEPRSKGIDPLPLPNPAICGRLLIPQSAKAVRKEPVFRTGERWNVVNNMNGEKK